MPVEKPPKAAKNKIPPPAEADQWSVTVFTDPLCCWSWAMRREFQRLAESVTVKEVNYRMAGLLPSWRHFADQTNAISKPIQMGPEWMHAKAVTGAAIDNRIWIADPPSSSYPACIAVKAASLQSSAAEEQYFYLAQQAVMTQRRNIAKLHVLHEIAAELSGILPEFNPVRFQTDLTGPAARQLFRQDIADWKYLQLGRMPTLIFKSGSGAGRILSGYQTAETIAKTLSSR